MPKVNNWINGLESTPFNGTWLDKYNPHTGLLLCQLADSNENDVNRAVSAAKDAYSNWSELTPVKRGQVLSSIATIMKGRSKELADCIALETGKPPLDAINEVNGAILQCEFFAGEGMRLYGRSLTSAIPGKNCYTIRQSRGVAALIVPANTPIANIAWKTFPALICGNTVALKAAEDSPLIANLFAEITKDAGLPDGVFNVIHGSGQQAGAALVNDKRISIISFTGSTDVGRWINGIASQRLVRVSLELGGKNPFVVCDDADIDEAVHWASLSAFSNAGQRCAAGSRILVFENIYESFRNKLVKKVANLKLGIDSGCDVGPVINKRQQENILLEIQKALSGGGRLLCGGSTPSNSELANGYYIQPTIIDSLPITAQICNKEIFGPVVTLHRVSNLKEALDLANLNEYGLTAAIHTRNVDRALWFTQRVRAGVANINLGTFGSEPHMPFGGFGSSGNGTREPGVEALDVYSEIKNISLLTRSTLI